MLHSAISVNLDVVEQRSHVIDGTSDQRSRTIVAASQNLLTRTNGLKERMENALDFVSTLGREFSWLLTVS